MLLYVRSSTVIPAPYQVRDKLQRESRSETLDSPGSKSGAGLVKPGMTPPFHAVTAERVGNLSRNPQIPLLQLFILNQFFHFTFVNCLPVVEEVKIITQITGHIKILLHQDNHAIFF